MVGDWFSAQLILSTEDLLDCLNENDIVENRTLFFAIAETINTRFPCIIELSHAHTHTVVYYIHYITNFLKWPTVKKKPTASSTIKTEKDN